MNTVHSLDPPKALFPGWRVQAIKPQDEAALQAFFEANPAYSVLVSGQLPQPQEAREEIASCPPEGMPWREQVFWAWVDGQGRWQAIAGVIVDLLAPGVWHIGLFMVDERLHGQGVAQQLIAVLHEWRKVGGAQWSRLGVVQDNLRAERFWLKEGYQELCQRYGVVMGLKIHTVRVMVKPLGQQTWAQYLDAVPRDRVSSAV